MSFTTRKSLLIKVRDGDEISWSEFYYAYKPLILLCGNDCHLYNDEKDELVQLVMTEIFNKDILSKYDIDNVPDNIVFKHDHSRGRFRHFIKGVIRNQALKIYAKRRKKQDLDKTIPQDTDDNWDKIWDEEWYRHTLTMALVELKLRVQAETFLAFEMYALQNRPVYEVSDFLNISVSSVYTAKSRCLTTMREIMKNLDER